MIKQLQIERRRPKMHITRKKDWNNNKRPKIVLMMNYESNRFLRVKMKYIQIHITNTIYLFIFIF